MSGYEFDDDIFFNMDPNTLPNIDNYRYMEHMENTNNTTHNGAQEYNMDNVLVHNDEVEDAIVDLEFHRKVQEIMRRDRHYFLQLMAQSGTKISHDFDISQILENPPTQGNQGNMDQKWLTSGGNTRQRHMLESPNLKKDHITPSPRKQDISSKYPLDRKFTPLGQSIELALKELYAHNLITLPNTSP